MIASKPARRAFSTRSRCVRRSHAPLPTHQYFSPDASQLRPYPPVYSYLASLSPSPGTATPLFPSRAHMVREHTSTPGTRTFFLRSVQAPCNLIDIHPRRHRPPPARPSPPTYALRSRNQRIAPRRTQRGTMSGATHPAPRRDAKYLYALSTSPSTSRPHVPPASRARPVAHHTPPTAPSAYQ